MRSFLKLFLIGFASLYVLGFLAIYFFQEKMVFMPESLPMDYQYNFSANFNEINLTSKDGAILNTLHFTVENPKGVLLYFHGNAGQLASWGLVVQKFVEKDYDVFVMDYRGYGKSTGALSEKALYSDAQLFYDYLLKMYPENQIVVYGRSLGTTFATYVAAQNDPNKLLLEAPFYSLKAVAQERFRIYPVSYFLKYQFPTYKYIGEVRCPIIILHGTADRMVNYKNSLKLAQLVNQEQLHLISIDNGNHNDLVDFPEYMEAIDSML